MKNYIDFECDTIAEGYDCLHSEKIYNPYEQFSCSDFECKGCFHCTKKDRCENPERYKED